MVIGYEKYLKEIQDSQVKTALRLTFDKAFSAITDEYDHRTRMNVFNCFLNLINDVSTHGANYNIIKDNPFYIVYTEFCDRLFGWIEESAEKSTIYEILEKVAEDIIVASIAEGLKDETITPEELWG